MMTSLSNDLAQDLLQKYEPILWFDSDNHLLPMDTDVYVRHCSLWETPRTAVSLRKPKMIKDWGTLTRRDLGAFHSPPKSIYYLSFARPDEATSRARSRQGLTTTSGHLIREGLKQYAALSEKDRTPTYHGRAFHSGSFLVLQYWFFYAVNDFKTSHGGINDHEGDWEGISLFLPRDGGETRPTAATPHIDSWRPLKLLAAAHEGSAPREWEAVQREGDHPVFFIARGSHATYYDAGRHTVDRADGQGIKVGPGTANPWRRIIFPVEAPPPWVTGFDGAWGYYSRDALGGFNGPGGLRQTIKFHFLRGLFFTPRSTWADPVGEAGLGD